MGRNRDFYKDLIFDASCGYAYLKATDTTEQINRYTFLEVNAFFCKMTGLNNKKIIGSTYKEIASLLKWNFDLKSIFNDVLVNKVKKTINKYLEHSNTWYEIIISSPQKGFLVILFIGQGNPSYSKIAEAESAYAVSDAIDFTKYKIDRAKEKNHQNQLETLMDIMPDYVSYRDIQGVYIKCNRAAARDIYGLEENEIHGKTCWQLFKYIEDAREDVRQDREVINARKILSFEKAVTFDDGSKRFLEIIKAPLYDTYGKIIGVVSFSRDMTNRKTIEEKIEESEARFRQLAENIEETFWLSTNDEMLYISPGFERIWERSTKSVYKDISNFRKHIYKEDQHRIQQALKSEAYKINGQFNEKYRIVKPDGTLRWVWEKIFPIRDEHGKIIRRAGVVEDITTLKVAEEVVARTREEIMQVELKKKSLELEQLSELERLRTDFFANLSHELRTPINLILASLKMIELFSEDHLKNEEMPPKKYLKIIKQNSYRLMRLINNLIDVTRLDAGFMKLSISEWDIIDITKKITLSVAEYARTKELTLSFDSNIDQKKIKCDADKIERILLNLLSNAVKFNIPKGSINVFISATKEEVHIYIKDTGIGIPEEKLKMIFERFKQVDSRLTKEGEGSGIGLSLVKAFVEMHNGTISVDSVIGSGTQFIIKLPIDLEVSDSIKSVGSDSYEDFRVERIRMEFSDIYGIEF